MRRKLRGMEVAQVALMLVIAVVFVLAIYFLLSHMMASIAVPDFTVDVANSYVSGQTTVLAVKAGISASPINSGSVYAGSQKIADCQPDVTSVTQGGYIHFTCNAVLSPGSYRLVFTYGNPQQTATATFYWPG